MQRKPPHLNFTCPKKWSDLVPSDHGRYCSQCDKHVTDFSKKTVNSIKSELLQSSYTDVHCGSFYAFQLSMPYKNWKDKIISLYQRVSGNVKIHRLIRPILLFTIMGLLLFSGCRRRLTGAVAHSSNDSNKKPQKVEQQDTKKKKVKF